MRVFQKGSISFSQRPDLLEDSWMESKFLNHAGKEMLIKAVLTIIIKHHGPISFNENMVYEG